MIKALNLHLTKNDYTTRTCPAKRGSMATLIKAILYLEIDSFALFFVKAPKVTLYKLYQKCQLNFCVYESS